MLEFLMELSRDGLLTDKEIREELNTNMVAVFGTLTHTLTSIMLLLGTYPEIQQKIYMEMIQELGIDGDIEKNDLQKLLYTKAVIKEGLRVISNVPILPRYVDKEVKLTLWKLYERIYTFCINMGGVIFVQIGKDVYYCITDPEDALTVANSCLQKHFSYGFTEKWLGQGLITASGEIHKRHRKLLNTVYTAPAVHGYLHIFNTQAKKLIDEYSTYSGKGPFVPLPMIQSMVLESACLTTFGSDTKDKEFLRKYMNATEEMLYIATQRFTKFYLHSNFINRLIGFQKREDVLLETLDRLTYEVMRQKKAAMADENAPKNHADLIINQETSYKTMLEFLMELSRDGLLTDKEIREELNTNMAAVFDTLTHTLTSIMLLLGTYPEIQQKIYMEMIQELGMDADVEKNDLQKLVYTKAVIKEGLRVISTVPILPRYVDKEVKLKNYTLRANSQCLIFTAGIHRHAAWGPDAEQFKPERWLEAGTSLAKLNKTFAGFSMGKRSCVGVVHATTLLSVVLAHLVRRYKWTADVTKVVMKYDVTLKASSGHEISIERREMVTHAL